MIFRYAAALLTALVIIVAAIWVGNSDAFERDSSLILFFGVAFGILLQRSRFCFFCILRDLFEYKDGRPLTGLILALIIGSLGYLMFFSTWVTDPSGGSLPQDAHIGPASWHLLLGGLLFGWGMALSGSCISAHFYRLGEGSVVAPFALIGSVAGFILGYIAWNHLYLATISSASVLWLPEFTGYTWAIVLQTLILVALIIWLLVKFNPADKQENYNRSQTDLKAIGQSVFINRWPTWVGGIGVGILAFFYYFRNEPLGVTAELGRISRDSGDALAVIPGRIEGLDSFAGCTVDSSPEILSANGVFIVALVLGALFTALIAGQFKPKIPSFTKAGKGLGGGILLGFGAMISLGCTIGTTLSGIMAFAVSGWVFTIAMVVGVWSGIKWNWHR